MVARGAAGVVFGPGTRRNSGDHRLLPHLGMVALLQYLWPTLAAGRADGRTSAHRHRPLGDTRGLDAALHPAAPWLRPCDFFRPVCRYARRRHRPGDLLQCGSGDLTWRAPLTVAAAPWLFSSLWRSVTCAHV